MVDCHVICCILAALLLIHDGQGQTNQMSPRQRLREKQRYRLAELSRANTAFGIRLYQQLARQNSDNMVFSPFSVFTALSMTLLGTAGDTKRQTRAVLAQRPRQGVHRALHAAIASFPRSAETNVTLRVANAMYYDDQAITIRNSFLRAMRIHYGAHPQAFERPEPETAINDWVSRATGGRIQDFLAPGAVGPDMVMMLLNAVYFQGTWKDVFIERMTRQGDFTTASGQVVRVPMMSRDGMYAVKVAGSDLAAMVLELPYGTDGRYSMFILLPDEPNGLQTLEGQLNNQNLEVAVSNMPAPSYVSVMLPKFELRTKTSMKDVLRAIGLTHIFQPSANFSRLAPGRLLVNDVKHEAVIEVNERGTVAAAVTSVGVVAVSLPPPFHVNRPFVLVLRDNKARLNLFMGRVTDPSVSLR